MKKNLLLLLASVVLAVSPLLVTTGCKAPQQVAAYKTLAVTQASVATARSAFLDRYAAGKVDEVTARKVLAASEKFNKAFNAAIIVAKTSAAPTPLAVAGAASEFLSIVSTFIK